MAHDVFISYASEDKVTADAVCARLEQHDIRCWIAPRDILPGMAWKASIVHAIEDARALVLVFTARSNASSEVAKEIAQAAQHGLSIITFRIENVPLASALKYDLDAIHWLDALTPPVERHIDQLASKLRVVLDKAPMRSPPQGAGAPTAEAPGTSRALAVAVALTCVVASAALGWFAFGGSESRAPAPGIAIGQPTAPAPAAADEVAVIAPAPRNAAPAVRPRPAASTERASAAPAAATAPGADAPGESTGAALRGPTGCWTYNNVLHLALDADGRVTGFLGGRWRASGTNEFVITWPPTTDTVVLAADGQSVSGSNNYAGPGVSGRRAAGAPDQLAGSWNWMNGQTVVFQEDGRALAANLAGTWTELRDRTFRIIWDYAFVDRLTLSPDGRTISGRNQLGQPLSGVRVPCD